jgi:uncharacterized membrane protein
MSRERNVRARLSDHAVEQLIGRMLQIGVAVSALVLIAGGALLLAQHGGDIPSYAPFRGEPAQIRSLAGIVQGAWALQSQSIVQLGLVLLIATPILRVALTWVAFLIQRDRMYVGVTTIVLAVLVYGLVFGRA